jgi:UDP-N-acetylmuramoylalanine--D-glutamate ligase
MEIKNKKVLLVGLGILGGGLSMARYLLKNGAILTITDLRDKKTLGPMISRLPKSVRYVLGKHREEDFKIADLIIFNPAVSILSPWAKLARKLKKEYYNDYTFFLKAQEAKTTKPKIIGITGTRGKTTTSLWINHLVPTSTLGGNIPEKGLLKILNKKTNCYVLELSSFQLEYAGKDAPSPHIAIITNIYNDHLNRYGKFDIYAKMKFNIFKNQTKNDFLILNADEDITKEVLKEKPKANIYYVSQKPLLKNKSGLYFSKDTIYFQEKGMAKKIFNVPGLSRHEKANLLCALLAAQLSGEEWSNLKSKVNTLPMAPLRQEVIINTSKLTVVNDSAGTSPDATIAAIEKFGENNDFVLISGGTDKELDFSKLARKINDYVPPKNLYLLSGSGTDKLISELKKHKYIDTNVFDDLRKLVSTVSKNHKTGIIVFSPGGASFEKFKNEFDRGSKFTNLAKKYFIEK